MRPQDLHDLGDLDPIDRTLVRLLRADARTPNSRLAEQAGNRETARLLVSELVANAVLHTDSRQIICRIEASGPCLRLEVVDEGSGIPEAPSDPGADAECGRGLMLLDALAHSWGVLRPDQGGGCTVWAEIRP